MMVAIAIPDKQVSVFQVFGLEAGCRNPVIGVIFNNL